MEALCEQESVSATTPIVSNPVITGKLIVMGWHRNNELEWDRNNPEQVAKARAGFKRAIQSGYMAYKINTAAAGEVIRSFDPDAETIVLQAQLVGG